MPTTLAKSLRADRISGLRLRTAVSVSPATPISEAVRSMTDRRTGCTLITDEAGQLVGIFTERDFLNRVVAAGRDAALPVQQVMSPAPSTVDQNATVRQVIEAMTSGGFRHLPVVGEDGRPVGVVSIKDVVHYLVEYFPAKVYNLPPTPDQTQPAREGA